MLSKLEKIPPVTEQEWQQANKFNRNLTEEFLQESMQLSPQTIRQYESGLKIFFRWVNEELDNKRLVDIKSRDYLKYQNYLVRRGLSSSAIKFKRAAISSLNGYVMTYYEDEYPTFRNFITKNIANPPSNFVNKKDPLAKEEFDLLLNELIKRKKWQQVAYIMFSFTTACRKGESMQLLKEVVNYAPVIRERNGKTIKYYETHDIRCKGRGVAGEVRKLQFNQETMDYLNKWLEVRGEDDCPYMFVTMQNNVVKQVGQTTFNDWCKGLFTKIVGKRVHPHGFRAARATSIVVEDGKDIKAAQALLGHKNSQTTEIYVVRDESEDLDEIFGE